MEGLEVGSIVGIGSPNVGSDEGLLEGLLEGNSVASIVGHCVMVGAALGIDEG